MKKTGNYSTGAGQTRVLDAAATLGGTLIKAAQFASTRPDLLPTAYTETLSSLQDRVPPQPWSVMEPAISRELGRPIPEVFDEIEPEPIAAASIAQVHRARLKSGREVAVKVQYPHVAGLIEADLSALERTFAILASVEPGVRLQPIADYLRWTLPLELDFEREAAAIENLRAALEDREDVVVPEVVEELTTERLLVMELMEGVRITDRDALLESRHRTRRSGRTPERPLRRPTLCPQHPPRRPTPRQHPCATRPEGSCSWTTASPWT